MMMIALLLPSLFGWILPQLSLAALKQGGIIDCNPPSGVDLGIGSNGLLSMWILWALLYCSCPAALCWTQYSSIPILSFGRVPIGSGDAFLDELASSSG